HLYSRISDHPAHALPGIVCSHGTVVCAPFRNRKDTGGSLGITDGGYGDTRHSWTDRPVCRFDSFRSVHRHQQRTAAHTGQTRFLIQHGPGDGPVCDVHEPWLCCGSSLHRPGHDILEYRLADWIGPVVVAHGHHRPCLVATTQNPVFCKRHPAHAGNYLERPVSLANHSLYGAAIFHGIHRAGLDGTHPAKPRAGCHRGRHHHICLHCGQPGRQSRRTGTNQTCRRPAPVDCPAVPGLRYGPDRATVCTANVVVAAVPRARVCPGCHFCHRVDYYRAALAHYSGRHLIIRHGPKRGLYDWCLCAAGNWPDSPLDGKLYFYRVAAEHHYAGREPERMDGGSQPIRPGLTVILMTSTLKPRKNLPAQTVGRAALLLQIIAPSPNQNLRLIDIADMASLDECTAQRELKRLEIARMLVRDPYQGYRLGPLIYELRMAAFPENNLRDIAEQELRQLA